LTQGLDILGQKQGRAAHTGRCEARFGAGVAAADHKYIKMGRKLHGKGRFLAECLKKQQVQVHGAATGNNHGSHGCWPGQRLPHACYGRAASSRKIVAQGRKEQQGREREVYVPGGRRRRNRSASRPILVKPAGRQTCST
jgi:hypothetical protein